MSGSPSISGERGCESYYTNTIGWAKKGGRDGGKGKRGRKGGKNAWTPMHNKHVGVKRALKRVITEISRRKWEQEYRLTGL